MNSFPFTSQSGDRKVKTSDFRELFKKYFTNGVFNGTFNVVQSTGMKVILKAGWCNIQGCFGWTDDDIQLTIDSVSQETTHNIVLRLDDNRQVRTINAYVVKGNPSAPSPTRTETVYELVVARIKTNASTTSITQSMIEDTRLDSSLCGIVANTVNVLDTTTYYNQLQGALDEFLDTVKQAVDGTLAGNLQSQINQKSKIVDGLGKLLLEAPMTPNDNLLINSDFKSGIINQQGKTQYDPVNKWTLSADGWLYFGQMQVFVQENQIRLYATFNNTGSCYFKQTVKNLKNEKCIVYIHVVSLSGSAKVTLDSGVDVNLKVGDNFLETEVKNNTKQLQISLNGKGVDLVIDEMKFEYGDNFTGMPVWNYEDELFKCIKKYISFIGQQTMKSIYVGQNFAVLTYELPFPVYKKPSIVIPENTRMSWQNHDSAQPTDTNITSGMVTGIAGNAVTIQLFGNFGNSTWKSAYMHGVGIAFDFNEY